MVLAMNFDKLIKKARNLVKRYPTYDLVSSEQIRLWFHTKSEINHSDELQEIYRKFSDQNISIGLQSELNAYYLGLAKGYELGLKRRDQLDRKRSDG